MNRLHQGLNGLREGEYYLEWGRGGETRPLPVPDANARKPSPLQNISFL